MENYTTPSARPLQRVVIKEEFVALTGDYKKALILGQLEYWQKRVREFDAFIEEEAYRLEVVGKTMTAGSLSAAMTQGWIYKTAEALSEETMLGLSKSNIRGHLRELVERGWLLQRSNPHHKWDKTLQYRLNLLKIDEDLRALGYTLQGWQLPVHRSSETELRPHETELQGAEKHSAISETTLETTTEHIKKELPGGSSKEVAARSSSSPLVATKKVEAPEEETELDVVMDFVSSHPRGDDLYKLIQLAAAENKTKKMAWSRARREFVDRFKRSIERNPDLSDEAWAFGFDQALSREAPNVGYVLAAAKNYKPGTKNNAPSAKMIAQGPKTPGDGVQRLLQDPELRRYAHLAEQFDFTSNDSPPWYVLRDLGGDPDERNKNLRRIKSAVGWRPPKAQEKTVTKVTMAEIERMARENGKGR